MPRALWPGLEELYARPVCSQQASIAIYTSANRYASAWYANLAPFVGLAQNVDAECLYVLSLLLTTCHLLLAADIEREIASLKRDEQRLVMEIKKAAKQGNTPATKVLAKSLVRLRGQVRSSASSSGLQWLCEDDAEHDYYSSSATS